MTGFNQRAFADAVAAVIADRHLSDREVARQVGVASSTITRVVTCGLPPSVDVAAKLAAWAGLSLDAFVVRPAVVAR